MKKILVTGALGVIGQKLILNLKSSNYDVISVDLAIRDEKNYFRADVTYYEDLYKIFRNNKIDAVIHMAGEVGRMVGEEHPQKMLYVNDVGTLNIIKLCLEFNSKLVYFSTSEVYGNLFDKGVPVNEHDLEISGSPFITTNIYAMSKLFGEALVKHYVENYSLNAVTIRPFMIYGPGEYPSKYRSALSNFIYAAIKGEEITVHRNTLRAWCFIEDFINGVKLVLEMPSSTKYEAYNIGSDEYHSMEEVAQMIKKEIPGSKCTIALIDPPEHFLSAKKIASIEKIKRVGYSPQISLKQGINIIAEWQKKEVFKR